MIGNSPRLRSAARVGCLLGLPATDPTLGTTR